MKKRILSMLLVVCMLMSMLPTAVFADASNEASVNGTEYATLAGAIEAAENGDTITLLSNVSVSDAYTRVDKSLTIDFGGYTMTSDGGGFDLYGGSTGDATLTLQHGTLQTLKWGVWVQEGANLVVASDMVLNATSTEPDKGGITVQNTGSEVTIYGKVTAAGGAAVSGIGNLTDGGVTINIEDGAVITNTNANGLGIYYPNTSNLNINGGTIIGATGVYVKSGKVNISGGQIIGNGTKADYTYKGDGANATGNALVIDRCGYPGGDPDAEVTGGSFSSANNSAVGSYAGGTVTEPATGFISGGTFTGAEAVPPEYLASGMALDSNGNVASGYEIICNAVTGANVSGLPKYAAEGTTVSFTVAPEAGYTVDQVLVNSGMLPADAEGKYTFTMPASEVTVTAKFTKVKEESPFADVSKDDYYYDAVKWASDKGITGGVGGNLFAPKANATRAENSVVFRQMILNVLTTMAKQ